MPAVQYCTPLQNRLAWALASNRRPSNGLVNVSFSEPLPGRTARFLQQEITGSVRSAVVLFEASKGEPAETIRARPVFVISLGVEGHQNIMAAMNRCGLTSVFCKKFVEAPALITTGMSGVIFSPRRSAGG